MAPFVKMSCSPLSSEYRYGSALRNPEVIIDSSKNYQGVYEIQKKFVILAIYPIFADTMICTLSIVVWEIPEPHELCPIVYIDLMLCDSTSPLLKNVSVKMPESLQKLIARMHSAKKRLSPSINEHAKSITSYERDQQFSNASKKFVHISIGIEPETGTDSEIVTRKFKPSYAVGQESDLAENTEPNVGTVDYENVNPNSDSSGVDSTVIIMNEASPVSQNASTVGNDPVTPSGRKTVPKTDSLATPVNNPPLDTAVIRSSLKTRSCGPKKWVTFNDIVQAESQTRFINDFSADRLKTINSKSERMQIDIQPVFVDDFYTHQSHCMPARDSKSDVSQISSQTNLLMTCTLTVPKQKLLNLKNDPSTQLLETECKT
ncbi:hypothetical protein ACFE04_011157 [Oxalis oulophora]